MTQSLHIPGKRILDSETFYTDWVPRGGDCMILRVQILTMLAAPTLTCSLETRAEDGTTAYPVTVTHSSSGSGNLEMTAVGIGTGLYRATTSGTEGNGCQEQVRVKIACSVTQGAILDVRIFPIIFFDSAKAY